MNRRFTAVSVDVPRRGLWFFLGVLLISFLAISRGVAAAQTTEAADAAAAFATHTFWPAM